MRNFLITLLALVITACSAAPTPTSVEEKEVSVATQEAQTIPNWCYEYPVSDGLNTWGNWGLWNNSFTGVTKIGSAGSSKSPPGNFQMSFAWTEPVGYFMALDRYISMTSETTDTFSKCGGRAPQQNFNSRAKFCAASVFARTPQGAHVSFQMLEPDTYLILSQIETDLPVSSTWTRVSIPLAYNCRTDVVMRMALVRSSTSASVQFDDFTVLWYY